MTDRLQTAPFKNDIWYVPKILKNAKEGYLHAFVGGTWQSFNRETCEWSFVWKVFGRNFCQILLIEQRRLARARRPQLLTSLGAQSRNPVETVDTAQLNSKSKPCPGNGHHDVSAEA
jgi:hypothetical protein